jgi:PAS domain S-box-containing protein
MSEPPLPLPADATCEARLAHLAHAYAQLAAVLDQSPDAVVRLSAAGQIQLVNAAFERLTGWQRVDAVGRPFHELLAPRDERGAPLPTIAALLAPSTNGTRASRYLEGTIAALDGTRLPVSFAIAALRDPDGRLNGAVITMHDLRRAESADALRASFLAVVSHELQTPLSIIKGYASTLARPDRAWSADTLREGLAVIEEEADRLSRLIDDLLVASRIQAVGLTAERIPVDLPSLVTRLLRRFQTAHPEHRFRALCARDVPSVLADHEKIEMVLRNLLDNAVKHAPPGSTIRVRVQPEPDRRAVRVSVYNRGPRIPAAARERVFERFYQVDGGDARRTRGAGLGLFICRAIIQAHNGHIWIEENRRPGTTVVFTLPVE